MSGFPAALVAKVVVPVVLIAGGGVAFVASVRSTKPVGDVRAWIDSPLDGATVRVGQVEIIAHGSGPSDVERIELVVDGATAGDFGPLVQTDRLATGSNQWAATVGTHALVTRVRVGSTIVESAPIGIVVTDDLSLLDMPERGGKPRPRAKAVARVATTVATIPPTAEITRTIAVATTADITTTTIEVDATSTTAPVDPSTTVARTTSSTATVATITTVAPGEPPRVAGVLHSPNSMNTDTDVSVLVRASNPSGHPITITISMKGPTGVWSTVKTCVASPCVYTSRFSAGDWQYRASVVDDLGRSATSADTAQTRFTVDPIIK
jgi:hypothetical protein